MVEADVTLNVSPKEGNLGTEFHFTGTATSEDTDTTGTYVNINLEDGTFLAGGDVDRNHEFDIPWVADMEGDFRARAKLAMYQGFYSDYVSFTVLPECPYKRWNGSPRPVLCAIWRRLKTMALKMRG